MSARRLAAAVLPVICACSLLAWHVGVAGAAPSASTSLSCQIADPENIMGAGFVNNQFVHGTWSYATGVVCSAPVTDIALYLQLNHDGTKVDSKLLNFTGHSRSADAILSQFVCAVCNGAWHFIFAQIVEAPDGLLFSSASSGCVLLESGKFLVCVQTTDQTL